MHGLVSGWLLTGTGIYIFLERIVSELIVLGMYIDVGVGDMYM